MKYFAPKSIDETLVLLRDIGPSAKVLAGGQDIVPLMNQGRLFPATIVDLHALRNLAGARRENGSIVIHALTPHSYTQSSPLINSECGLLSEAASQIGGGLQVRNRGTIGGAVCAASPVYDSAPCLVALGARFRLQSATGQRSVAASDFFHGAGATDLKPTELLLEIIVPVGYSRGYAYEKLKFVDGCYCIASVACALKADSDGSIEEVRLVLGGVEPVPTRLGQAEQLLRGSKLTKELLRKVQEIVPALIQSPITDVQADGEYRRSVSGVLVGRALGRAFRRVAGKG